MPPTPLVNPAVAVSDALPASQSLHLSGDTPLRDPFAVRSSQHHDLVGIAKRQRPQQRGVDQREDGAVGADAQGERQRRHEGEGGRRPHLAQREHHVVPRLVDPLHHAHLALSLSAQIHAGLV